MMKGKYLNVRNILEIQNPNLILTTKFKTLLLIITPFGGSGGFAAVFSQFHIVPTSDSHHTKGPRNSFMKAFTPGF